MDQTPDSVRFGRFWLDPQTLELWHNAELVALEPLNARILLRLVTDAGKMVPRHVLLELGWPELPGTAEQSLNNAVHQIRRALAQKGGSRVELETLRGRGYRLKTPRANRGATAWRFWSRYRWPLAVTAAAAFVFLLIWPNNTSLPTAADRALERAFYLAETTGDIGAARQVLDSARTRFPHIASFHGLWSELTFMLDDRESAGRVATLALEIDPSEPSGHRTLARLAMVRGEWSIAESELVAALVADQTDTRTLTTFAHWRVIEGRFAEAGAFLRRALEVDPLSTILRRDAGHIYLLAGQYDEAEQHCAATLRFQPKSAWAMDCMFDLMVLQGRHEDAAAWGNRLVKLSGGPDLPRRSDLPGVVADVEAWRLRQWNNAVQAGAYPYGLALALAANGRHTEAVDALRLAAARPTVGFLSFRVDPRLATLRSTPEFLSLINQLHIPSPAPS